MFHFIIAIAIFIAVYIAIASEKINKTIAALFGGSLMLIFRVLPQEEAFAAIDLNVILLLVGMMSIVHIMSKTGVFQWLAIKLAQLADGEPLKVLIFLSIASAVLSAFLDNVTTMLLLAPVTFLISDELELDPVPFLILMAIASNIGGTATLIGDPPNIIIGSAAGYSFNDFIVNLVPVIAVIVIFYVITIIFMFRHYFHVSAELKARLKDLRPEKAIKNKILLTQTLSVLVIVFALFFMHHKFELEAATVAILGASFLHIITGHDPDDSFKNVEWATIFFFIGLFILVEGLVKVGVIKIVAEWVINLTKGSVGATSFMLLWFSAIFSAVVDNIPYTATMIPIVEHVGNSISAVSGVEPDKVLAPLWWSLSLGACLGGNGTVIGASANVIVVGLARKNGHSITFWDFFKYGIIFLIESMVISTVYIYMRYL